MTKNVAAKTWARSAPTGPFHSSPSGSPTYTPFFKSALGAGTPGQNATTDFNNLSGRSTVVSTDISGPFGESQIVKVGVLVANSGNYGGSFNNSGTPLSVGDETWFRLYCYFPTAFCAGAGGGGDFDQSIKFYRPTFASGQRLYGKLGGFTNNACANTATSPTMLGLACDFAPVSNDYVNSPQPIPRDTWVALQWYIKHGQTAGTSVARVWIGSAYQGDITMTEPMYPATASDIGFYALGDYYNGGAKQDTWFYISNVIATKQQPNTVDSGGRPYISPTARISDFT